MNMMKRPLMTLSALLVLTLLSLHTHAQEPIELAKRANDYFMAKWSDPSVPTNAKKLRPSNLWTRGVYYEGLMALHAIAPDNRYMDYVDKWGEFHKWGPYSGKLTTVDADHQCCAQTYFMRYQMIGGDEKIEKCKTNFDNQIKGENVQHWFWIDAIQMAMPAYAILTQITKDRKYLDYAMRSYVWTRDTCGGGLFNKAEGLWWRDKNFVPPYKESDGKNCYWSRGNGWVYAALVRVMSTLPKNDPYYKQLKKDYLAMTKALISLQREDGFWNASLASQDFAGPELSGTSLFLYGLSWGINNKLIKGKQYQTAIDKAWKACASCVHRDGFLGYVQGSGDRPASSQPCTFYREPDFDDYGLGCFLLGATEYSKTL